MILSAIEIIGFRNFKKAVVNLNEKSLIIGANDIGKTNLIWAIRLLLDRSLSDYDIEPQDADFYAFEETNHFKITLFFSDVKEDCVVAKLKGKISDDNKLILRYEAVRDPTTKVKSYRLFAGASLSHMEEIEDRYYRKVLNLKYIGSRRDLKQYISREKNHLLLTAKENRTDDEIAYDNKLYAEVQESLKDVDDKIPKLNFVKNATNTINEELNKLSLHHTLQQVVFDASISNLDDFINSVSISSKSNEQSVLIGGDGKLNQIYLALWTSRNQLREENITEVTIFCIEEPEAHLHPHQQRKLADYLNSELFGQVLITTHSPQIASEFSPNSIVRLYKKGSQTLAASDGCSIIINEAFNDFGYRMSIIPAEAFFANVVFLVEGPSEEIFFKTLAKTIDIDLDRSNISILMVDGIGFKTYVKILETLNVKWVLRTDNDVFKVPKKDEYRFAGIHRCVDIYQNYCHRNKKTDQIINENYPKTIWGNFNEPDADSIEASENIKNELNSHNIFLAIEDLEYDLVHSPIGEDLKSYFDKEEDFQIIIEMQKKKAVNMYQFLKKKKVCLAKLKYDGIVLPLNVCLDLSQK